MPRRARQSEPPDEAGARYALNIRTSYAVRKQLEIAARKSGRSLSAEVEHRLERSFERQEFVSEVREAVGTAVGTQNRDMAALIAELRAAIRAEVDEKKRQS